MSLVDDRRLHCPTEVVCAHIMCTEQLVMFTHWKKKVNTTSTHILHLEQCEKSYRQQILATASLCGNVDIPRIMCSHNHYFIVHGLHVDPIVVYVIMRQFCQSLSCQRFGVAIWSVDLNGELPYTSWTCLPILLSTWWHLQLALRIFMRIAPHDVCLGTPSYTSTISLWVL